ncbi:MAG: dihydrodipicolinate reductase [Aquabacterium sp.]|uniref:dihydrodipicolinate reductase C-terminal domain-containing protein n=1 Tax=Aquabacterium sp. TaxID=1872578 RepID=UPI0025C72A9D|nr:dihydrodipicolinate reductase C-terminal domain-containing protein [Aquabacterium sp.]MBI5924733.1 dihydrodipicolinate reductase [Aquabacterium sp.]
MQVIIAGTGKLATELRHALSKDATFQIQSWAELSNKTDKAIVVHAGSGRELEAIAAFCAATHSPLIELATGSQIEAMPLTFPVVLCPNTNILMLKFMAMLERCGPLFRTYDVKVLESHQASKTSVPGTAVNIAHSLGVGSSEIESVRDVGIQRTLTGFADADLARHAFHQIRIEDGSCSVLLETRVCGDAPYAKGVEQIVAAVMAHELQDRCYNVMEFVHNGWI